MLSLFALILALAAHAPSEPPRWTLKEALQAFQAGNPDLVDARYRVEQTKADRVSAGLIPNPELGLSLSNIPLKPNLTDGGNGPGLNRNAVYGVSVSQLLELGGKRGKRVALADKAIGASEADRDDVLRQRLFDVANAFYRTLLGEARHQLASEELGRYGETIRISRARFQAEDISLADLNKIELESLKYRNAEQQTRLETKAAKSDLLRLVGPQAPPDVEVEGELTFKEPPASPDLKQLAAKAVAARADVVAARRRVDAARAQLSLAQAQTVPDLSFGLGYLHSQAIATGDNPDALGATVSVPLPLFNRNQGEVQKARVGVSATEYALRAAEEGARRDVELAFQKLEAARALMRRFEEGFLEKAESAKKVAEKGYLEGAASLLSFLEAERTYIETRADYLQSLYDFHASLLELDRAVGQEPAVEHG